jgi:predicted GIY-YIG superfamily endonuclease
VSAQRSRKAPANGPTALYRFFDSDGDLLYVGITSNITKRFRYHQIEQATTWWPQAAAHTVYWHDTRIAAEEAEVRAIKTEGPKYNVMHTPRNRMPYGNRRGTVTEVSSTRGDVVLSAIRRHFPDAAFTQIDVLPHVPLCRSSVQKNFHALLLRKEIIKVGRRSDGRRGPGHALYALPDSPVGKSGQLVYDVSETGKLRRASMVRGRDSSWWKYGSPPGSSAFQTLQRARQVYGSKPFTRQALAELMRMSMPGLLKHVISLEKHDYIVCVGRSEPIPGRSGHPPKLYVVTTKPVPKPEEIAKGAASHPSRSPLYPDQAASAKDQGRLALLECAARAFQGTAFTVSAIAQASGIPVPTAYQRVRSLAEAGLLRDAGIEPQEGRGARARLWRVP